jgi:hypothetical protein
MSHANLRIPRRIAELGYCCPHQFFEANKNLTNAELATLLLASGRTVRFWKSRQSLCRKCLANVL